MSPIDPRELAQRAEEARRRAEALARLRQQQPPGTTPPPGVAPQARKPTDIVEKSAPSFFAKVAGVAPLKAGAPPLQASAPPPQTRLDAAVDRQQLAVALGPAAIPVAEVARPVPPVVSQPLAKAMQAGGPWARVISAVFGGPVASLGEKARWLEARAIQVKEALAATDSRNARTVVGLRTAGGFLEKAAFKAGIARELAQRGPGSLRGAIERLTAARQQFVDAQRHAGEAEAALREMGSKARAVPSALQDVREIQRVASQARFETSRTESRGAMVAAASETAPSPAAMGLGEDDLSRIGSALDPSHPPPQTSWSDHMLNTVGDQARQQGLLTAEQGEKDSQLARAALAADGATGPREISAADLAALLKQSGLDLTKVDPNQLQAAAQYVSQASSLDEQQQRLCKTLDTYQLLAKSGFPTLTRAQMVDELWVVARVPGHALTKLSDAELGRKMQEVLATVNAGPGKSEIKIGKYNLKLEVGQGGTVDQSSCKKPGFFSQVWNGIKKVAPIALTALSFIPVTAPFALAAQAAISMGRAIKTGSLLGIATAAASLVGAGGAIVSKLADGVGKVAATAERIARLANSAGRGLQGVSGLKSGNLVGGLANIGGAFATGLAEFAGEGRNRLGHLADKLNKVSAKMSAVGTGVASFEGYKKASQAVSAAKEVLQAAQARGDATAIAAAQKQLAQAESQKRAALIGGAAGAATAASAWSENRSLFADQSKEIPPARTHQQQNLRLAAQALGVAQGVAGKDLATAAVSGLSLGATLANAPQAANVERSTSARRLNDASNLAQAALGYYQAEKGRSAANSAVEAAQSRLVAARASGNAEAVRQAEADLKRAKAGAESALMGDIAAGQSLLETAKDIGEQHRSRAELERTRKSVNDGAADRDRLGALIGEENTPAALRTAARAATDVLEGAEAAFQKAVLAAGGEADKLAAARKDYEATRKAVMQTIDRATSTLAAAPPTAAPPEAPAPPSPGFASLRRPEKVVAFEIEKGMTIWEISQLTGVPEDRIRSFNAESGNPLEDTKLQIGQQILVPDDPEEVRLPTKTPTQIRALQRAALAAQATGSVARGAAGTLSAADAAPFAQVQQQFHDGKWKEGASSLAALVMQGTPEQKTLARQLLGQIEAQQLQSVQLLNTAKIQQINEAAESSTEGVGGFVNTLVMDGLAGLLGQPPHTDAVRANANEKQAELQDQSRAISAVQQIQRETGLTLYELGRVPPAELDATLSKVYPELSSTAVTVLRGNIVKALANPDVAAVSRANYSSFSWDRGLTQADTSFADTLLQATSKALGSTLRQARSDAEAFKNSPGVWARLGANVSADLLDGYSNAPRFLASSVQTAQAYYADLGGVSGALGGALTRAADFVLPALTEPLTLADYRATDAERTRALVSTALFAAGGALVEAGLPVAVRLTGGVARSLTEGATLTTRWLESGALGETAAVTASGFEAFAGGVAKVGARVVQLGRMSVADVASGLSDAVLRQGTRAAESLAGTPMGRAIAAANERVLAPLARFSADTGGALGRAADMAKDYFSLVNNFGKGPVMETGARVLPETGLAEVQARQEARKAYDAIRRSSDDVAQIAKSTGRSEAEIAQIKNYVFREEHQLAAGLRRFDPDPQIAAAWSRLQAGTQTAEDLALLQHEAEELMLTKVGLSQQAAHAAAAPVPSSDGLAFVGSLRGTPVELRGVSLRRIEYTKRAAEDLARLRAEFDSSVRKSFLRDLAADSVKVAKLRSAGLSDVQIQLMSSGGCPKGWQVHHKLPLDDGGTNDFENLVLSKYDPYHKVITNHQRALTRALGPGETRVLEFPIPDDFVYPLPRD